MTHAGHLKRSSEAIWTPMQPNKHKPDGLMWDSEGGGSEREKGVSPYTITITNKWRHMQMFKRFQTTARLCRVCHWQSLRGCSQPLTLMRKSLCEDLWRGASMTPVFIPADRHRFTGEGGQQDRCMTPEGLHFCTIVFFQLWQLLSPRSFLFAICICFFFFNIYLWKCVI